MREFSFDLKEFSKSQKKENKDFVDVEGKLVLVIPTYRQRLKMIKECNFKMNEKGEVSTGLDSLDSIVNLLDAAKPYFKKIDLKCGEAHVKTFEDMESYPEFDTLLTAAAMAVLNAGKLGK